jgi:hypothetical protein
MAFNIDKFRAALQYDGARPNLFECKIIFPTLAEVGNANFANETFTFMCRAAQLPGSTVNPIPMMYFGRELKFAGNRVFPEFTATIINDEDFTLRGGFEKWMNGLNSHRDNLRKEQLLSPNSYVTNMTITQYGKAGPEDSNGLRKYVLVGAFPIDVSPIELDWAANDTIEEYAVTFAYQWWEVGSGRSTEGGTGAAQSDGVNPIF